MLDKEGFDHLVEFFLLRNLKWRINGELRLPSRGELKIALDDMVQVVRDSPESISIELGSLLVKRSDDDIEVYVHVGEFPFYE